MYPITILPHGKTLHAAEGDNLLAVLREAGFAPEAPCGGRGTCGKCRVNADGTEVLACQTAIHAPMTVTLQEKAKTRILTGGQQIDCRLDPCREGYLLAFDIGTTTVVCYLLNPADGKELAAASMLNPQSPFGADVITRIQHALDGQLEALRDAIRDGMTQLICQVCTEAGIEPAQVGVLSVVGNPCMQQLFLGIDPTNLAGVPFAPVLTRAELTDAAPVLPICSNAALLIVPDISGYIGADTMGCVLSTKQYLADKPVLMVDIGTNGEMVLGCRDRMSACSTAAGPALEGAGIQFGMRGAPGAIDHVWLENGTLCCSVIGGGEAVGICGSGLIDAVAVLLTNGVLNRRGRMQSAQEANDVFAPLLDEVDGQRICRLTEKVWLTQNDIREVQLAKGAIGAGVELMMVHLNLTADDIDRVLLAGAFGSFLRPESACAIGLLPPALLDKITAVGNAAGSGARLLACDQAQLPLTQDLAERMEFLELAALPAFRKTFARNMNF